MPLALFGWLRATACETRYSVPGWVPRWLLGEAPGAEGGEGAPGRPDGQGKTGYFWKRSVMFGLERSPGPSRSPAAPAPTAAQEEGGAGAGAFEGLNRALAALAFALYIAALFLTSARDFAPEVVAPSGFPSPEVALAPGLEGQSSTE